MYNAYYTPQMLLSQPDKYPTHTVASKCITNLLGSSEILYVKKEEKFILWCFLKPLGLGFCFKYKCVEGKLPYKII